MTTAMDAAGAAIRTYLEALRGRAPGEADWSAAPARYKRYFGATRLPLPSGPVGELLRDLLGLVRADWIHPVDEQGRQVEGAPRITVGRPAPSGGGLYPIEGYLAGGGPGLPSGLFHYDPVHHALETLHLGDHRQALTGLLAAPPPEPPDLVLVLSAVFWRTGFKYGDFAYRLQCQEIGALAAQALALAEKLSLGASVHLLFDDAAADRLLGLDTAAESVLAVLTLTGTPHEPVRQDDAAHPPRRSPADDLAPRPAHSRRRPTADGLAPRPVDPPPINDRLPYLAALHAATRTTTSVRDGGLASPEPVATRTTALACEPADPEPIVACSSASASDVCPADPEPTAPPGGGEEEFSLPDITPIRLADGIPHRASPIIGYRPEPISPQTLAQILAAASATYPGDLSSISPTITLYVLALRVQGLPVGAYQYDAERRALLRIAAEPAARITGGPLAPNTRVSLRSAAAVLVPVGDPLGGVRWFGDRWYRLQQAETGLAVHRATLAAAALGLTSRIHSDGTTPATEAALGLTGSRRQALSFLLLGRPPAGPSLIRRLPAPAVDGVGSGDGTTPTTSVGAIHPPYEGRKENHVRQNPARP
ncbi:SagB family peptide dehydrogenase [Nonomuraea sp. NPDC049129]|uniref:SagB family peptide dehydrogenase n=1 Tax=Nonomuraea sp. NPDC049129 TaxID=3155272 RepID=UPI0033C4570B